MNTLTIGIYGKSIMECQVLLQFLKNIENIQNVQFAISTYLSPSALLQKHCDIFDVVFLFLDNCNAEAKQFLTDLRNSAPNVHLILISESDSVFSLGYSFEAANCWQKPVLFSNLLKEIDKLLQHEFLLSDSYMLFSSQKGIRKMYYRKLRYIETGNRQLILHYDGELFFYLGSLGDLENKLCSKTFFRCNNSYLVNVLYVEEIIPEVHRYKIRLITGEEIPLSRNKKNDLIKLMTSSK